MEGPPQPTPHYQLPNFASILSSDGNSEQDFIQRAYNAANFTSIRDLPDTIKPGEVTVLRQQHILENRKPTLSADDIVALRREAARRNGLFHEFEYIPSRYSLRDEMSTKERLESEARRLDIGGRDWACSSNVKKLKYEDTFEDKEYRFPYRSDPFQATQDQVMRAKWIEDSKILHGPFIPAGRVQTERSSRQMLPDIVKKIHRIIAEDWGDYDFQVLATEDDNIAIRFDMMTVDSEAGLQAYMHMLAASHYDILEYGLKRVADDWNAKPGDGFLYFLLVRVPSRRGVILHNVVTNIAITISGFGHHGSRLPRKGKRRAG